MTQPGPEDGARPEIKKTKSNLVEIATYSILAALLGAVLTFYFLRDGEDPDRPPIIVRNGSVIIEERQSSLRGELKHLAGKTWYHKHDHKGPKRLNAHVVGIANNSCGDGVTNYVSNIKKVIVTYELGAETRVLEIVNRANQIEIDVISGPDPTNLDAWTLSFDAGAARLKEVTFEIPGGTDRCVFDAGGRIEITQYHR